MICVSSLSMNFFCSLHFSEGVQNTKVSVKVVETFFFLRSTFVLVEEVQAPALWLTN